MNSAAGTMFRICLYTAICLATVGLWMGEDNPFPYPLLVVFCVVAAYAFTDTWEILSIPAAIHPWLAIGVVALFVREEMLSYKVDPVLPLGHLIALFQVILLFHVKTPRTYWLLLLTSFLQMLIAALHNNRLGFGVLMGIFLVLIVWGMTQFLMLREAERNASANQPISASAMRRSAAGSIGSSLIIFLAAMLLFLVIPRRGQTAWTQSAYRTGQYLSGFDERIRLGQLGTILESDEEVMTVRLYDERGLPHEPHEEPYWRGVALSYYEGGQWERIMDIEPVQLRWPQQPEQYIRQEIRLQRIHRDVLFGLWPAFRGQTRSGEPLAKIVRDGTLVRPDGVPAGPLQYTVDSIPGAPVRFRDERGPFRDDRGERVGQLTQVPNELLGPLRDYAAQHDLTKRSADSFCVSVLNHLSNSNEFDYSLRATQSDMNIDPVLDFLFNRKEGHCEYFASSMALLLRAHDVPARVVNGFKGGDRNELFGPSLVVRQKHAHSWVEALLPTADKSDYVWTSFDPTPGPGRQRVVALVNPTPTLVRQVRDISRQLWSDYVLNFNSSEQETAVYGPARRLIVEKGRQVIKGLHDMWKRRNARFNWVAAFAASGLMLVVILGGRYLARMLARRQPALLQNSQPGIGGFWGRLLGLMRGWVNRLLVRMSDANSRVAFYDEMLRTLESFGLSKKPTWTAFRFAEHARVELEANPAVSSAAHIPIELVDRYYRVRFGHESLNPSETDEVQRLLGQLGSTLKRQ